MHISYVNKGQFCNDIWNEKDICLFQKDEILLLNIFLDYQHMFLYLC